MSYEEVESDNIINPRLNRNKLVKGEVSKLLRKVINHINPTDLNDVRLKIQREGVLKYLKTRLFDQFEAAFTIFDSYQLKSFRVESRTNADYFKWQETDTSAVIFRDHVQARFTTNGCADWAVYSSGILYNPSTYAYGNTNTECVSELGCGYVNATGLVIQRDFKLPNSTSFSQHCLAISVLGGEIRVVQFPDAFDLLQNRTLAQSDLLQQEGVTIWQPNWYLHVNSIYVQTQEFHEYMASPNLNAINPYTAFMIFRMADGTQRYGHLKVFGHISSLAAKSLQLLKHIGAISVDLLGGEFYGGDLDIPDVRKHNKISRLQQELLDVRKDSVGMYLKFEKQYGVMVPIFHRGDMLWFYSNEVE